MPYHTIFEKYYGRERNTHTCYERGRYPRSCPAEEIINTLLKPVYGSDLRRSACESSVSLATRPDPLFSVLKQRATRQVHVFQKADPLGNYELPVGSLDIRCVSPAELSELKSAQHQWENVVFCASGYLKPPAYMSSESGYALPLLNYYSTHVGLLPFLCTPYISHHDFVGYFCAQGAAYLALEMVLPLNASPQSPAALSHIVAELCAHEKHPPLERALLCSQHEKHRAGGIIEHAYLCRGLTISELAILLDSSYLRTKCLMFQPTDRQEAALHMKTMLRSRIPIVTLVDINAVSTAVAGKPFILDEPGLHVITVVGYRAFQPDDVSGVIFHDGHLGPYREMDFDAFVSSALSAPAGRGKNGGRILMFSPLPKRVSCDIYRDVFQIGCANSSSYNCDIQLSSVSQLTTHLVKYAPRHEIKFSDALFQMLIHPWEKTLEETHPVWLVEYTCKGDGNRSIYLDVIDAEEGGNGRRIGTISLGQDPRKDKWLFTKGKERVTHHFISEVGAAGEEEKAVIRHV